MISQTIMDDGGVNISVYCLDSEMNLLEGTFGKIEEDLRGIEEEKNHPRLTEESNCALAEEFNL